MCAAGREHAHHPLRSSVCCLPTRHNPRSLATPQPQPPHLQVARLAVVAQQVVLVQQQRSTVGQVKAPLLHDDI